MCVTHAQGFHDCIEKCNAVLKYEPRSVKALFRKADALVRVFVSFVSAKIHFSSAVPARKISGRFRSS